MFKDHCLTLAGRGSGKTLSDYPKSCFLVQQCGIPAHRITAMTFTNKAARGMKERVLSYCHVKKPKGLSVSTFHTFWLKFMCV